MVRAPSRAPLMISVLVFVHMGCGEGDMDSAGDDEIYPPKIVLSLWEEAPLTPPCTHHVDIEVQSFDPAEGYLELWVGGRMLRRVLDPPPVEVYPVFNSVHSCQPPMPSCPGSYTAKLFLFSSPAPVAEGTINWRLLPAASVLVDAATEAPVKDGSSDDDLATMPPETARSIWPLNCTTVQFPGFPPPEAFLRRPLIVLAYPPHDLGWMHFDPAHAAMTSPPALWLMSSSCPEAADVLVFSCGYSQGKMGLGAPRVPRLPHQRFLHLCLESTGGVQNPLFYAAMDLTATYELSSDVPSLYAPGNLRLFAPAPEREDGQAIERDRLAMFVISHCGLARDLYLRQLFKFMHIDSYGKCLNTADLPASTGYEATKDNPVSPLVPLMRRYLFVFAFENSVQQDYVTEKFYIPLMAGAVPVYLGAPNIASFAPDAESFIDVSKFPSPEALASHLLHLQAHPAEYARLHAWRSRPWAADFRRIASQAINQGHIYNEGAVHGTAQRISPLRLTGALAARYLEDAEVQAEETIAVAVAAGRGRWRKDDDRNAFRVPRPGGLVTIEINEPSEGQVVTMSLLQGLSVSFRVLLGTEDSGEATRANGGGEAEGLECGDILEMVVVVDRTIRSGAQVRACEERRIQVEGLTPGKHSMYVALAPDRPLPKLVNLVSSWDLAVDELATPNTPPGVDDDSVEADWIRNAPVSKSITFLLESPSPGSGDRVCSRHSAEDVQSSSVAGRESSHGHCEVSSPVARYLNGDTVVGSSLAPLANVEEGLQDEAGVADTIPDGRECYHAVEALGGGGVAVVNLDRRPKRWEHVVAALLAAGFSRRDFYRVSAADGQNLSRSDPELTWLFRRNHFNSDPSVIGCALSHLRIWMRLIECHRQREARAQSFTAAEWVLVLEDDVELREGFLPLMRARLGALISAGRQWDFICVGSRQVLDEFVDFDSGHELEGIMRIRNYRNCHTHAYAINVRGAALMLEKAAQEGIICGLDWFMAIHHRRLRSYGMMPSLAGQQSDLAANTDIHGHSAHWGVGSQHAHLAEAGIL